MVHSRVCDVVSKDALILLVKGWADVPGQNTHKSRAPDSGLGH